jgi:hypothetical protein
MASFSNHRNHSRKDMGGLENIYMNIRAIVEYKTSEDSHTFDFFSCHINDSLNNFF